MVLEKEMETDEYDRLTREFLEKMDSVASGEDEYTVALEHVQDEVALRLHNLELKRRERRGK